VGAHSKGHWSAPNSENARPQDIRGSDVSESGVLHLLVHRRFKEMNLHGEMVLAEKRSIELKSFRSADPAGVGHLQDSWARHIFSRLG
jgi:hypothetical protein